MSRELCHQCQRPIKACICQFIHLIDNEVPVIILQHPKEVGHSKGTGEILANSLAQNRIIIGEDFTHNADLNAILEKYQPLLLYPGEHSIELSNNNDHLLDEGSKETCLMILDGTWKKAYKMLMLSENLQNLPQVKLPKTYANGGQYLIRKVAKSGALSSLEACCYALILLENNSDKIKENLDTKYLPLLKKFSLFNEFQLSFNPNR